MNCHCWHNTDEEIMNFRRTLLHYNTKTHLLVEGYLPPRLTTPRTLTPRLHDSLAQEGRRYDNCILRRAETPEAEVEQGVLLSIKDDF